VDEKSEKSIVFLWVFRRKHHRQRRDLPTVLAKSVLMFLSSLRRCRRTSRNQRESTTLPNVKTDWQRAKRAGCGQLGDRARESVSGQVSAVSGQPSAVSCQPSAVSRQPSAVSRQRSAVSGQGSAVSRQRSAVSGQRSAVC
jgi:hypothetical protein